MGDPTFAHHFSMAVQSDILRQAAQDRRGRQERASREERRPALLMASARRLAMALWMHAHRPKPARVGLTALSCPTHELVED